MADDSSLNVTITADAGSAAAAFAELDTRLAALEQSFIGLQAATASATGTTTQHAAAQTEVATALGRTETVATEAGAAVDYLGSHFRMASAGAEVLGLSVTEATAKLAAFAEVAEGLERTFAPLLVAIAAVQIAFSGFEYLKEGVAEAAALQSQMETLGAAVQAQGGSWAEAQDGLEKFIESETLASGFTAGQMVPGLNQLVTAGNDAHDAMQIMGVAEELARAKHMELGEATSLLISAEENRTRGIVKQDINLQAIVKTHGTFNDILRQLHKDMGEAINDSTGLEMQHARLNVTLSALAERIGKDLLPMLTGMATTMIGALQNAEDLGSGMVKIFQGIVQAGQTLTSYVAAMFTDMAKAGLFSLATLGDKLDWLRAKVTGDVGGQAAADKAAAADWASATGAVGAARGTDAAAGAQFAKAGALVESGLKQSFNEIFNGQDAYARGHAAVNQAIYEHNKRLDTIGLDNPIGAQPIGTPKKGPASGSTTTSFTPAEYDVNKVDLYAAAQKALDEQLKRVDDSEKGLAEKIKLAMTAQEQQSAQATYDAQVTKDLETKSRMLGDAVAIETTQQVTLTVAHTQATAAAKAATDAYNQYGNATNTGSTLTTAQSNHLSELKDRMDKAKKAQDELNSSLKEVTTNLDRNRDALATVNIDLGAFANKSQEAAAVASRAWESFTTKLDEQLKEDAATFGKTNAQKAAYYTQVLADMGARTAENEKEYERVYGLEKNAFKASLDEMQKAFQSWDDFQAKMAEKNTNEAATRGKTEQQIYSYYASLYAQDYALWLQYSQAKEVDLAAKLLPKMEADETAANDSLKKIYDQNTANAQAARNKEIQDVATFTDAVILQHENLGTALKNIFKELEKAWVDSFAKMVVDSKGFQSAFGNLGGAGSAGGSAPSVGGLFSAVSGAAAGAGGAPNGTQSNPVHVVVADSLSTQLQKTTGNPTGVAALSLTALNNSSASSNMAANVVGGNAAPPGGDTAALTSSLSTAIGKAMSGLAAGGAMASMFSGLFSGQNDSNLGGSLGGGLSSSLLGNWLGAAAGPLGGIAGSLIGGLFGSHEQPWQQPDLSNQAYPSFVANWQGMPGTFGGQTATPSNQYYTAMGGQSQEVGTLAEIKSILAPNSGAAPGLVALAKQLQALAGSDTASNALSIAGERQGVFTLGSGATVPVQQFMNLVSQFQAGAGNASAIPTFNISRSYGSDPNLGVLQSTGTTPSGGTSLAAGAIVVNLQGPLVGSNGMNELATIISKTLYAGQRGTAPTTGRSTLARSGGGF